ncbi:4-hydroxy-tetrahydrodipicolinate synthase [Chitiniphilus shinanonensis]|uniref:4-hydroxy-tetrahydrodipicolinate synthase n=1 Tax=Chitiniphilus shinanonensis TaxID=553088 RepID=A0ABQ6BMF0_9NEIS|nr:4-hydroxy-tetrahydrodipicolinate synthase [Chitiniphilus shinanonensis]GLS03103.1 4-hydroxy-tetrahydrodipicolinate synthase [Chitiniphilus shinanonensis]
MFEGIWVPMVTPLRDGALDLPAAARLASHLAGSGIAGLVLCGTTGEASALSATERRALFDAVRQAVDLPLIVGVSGSATAAVVEQAASWDEAGAAGLLVAAPYYVRPSQAGVRAHFEAVAGATRLPIVLYNIPYRTGVNIEVDTVRALARNPQFVAIKESGGGSLAQLAALLAHTPLTVLCGEDAQLFPAFCLGAQGAIAAAAHLHPQRYVQLLADVRAGRLAEAREQARRLQPLIAALFSEPNPAPLKAALSHAGWLADELRLPMLPAGGDCRRQLDEALGMLSAG